MSISHYLSSIFIILALVTTAPSLTQAADIKITQLQGRFDSDTMTIQAGDSLIFVNDDDMTHNIQVIDADGTIHNHGFEKPGQSITVPFLHAGTFNVRCTIHPKMKMTVVVHETP